MANTILLLILTGILAVLLVAVVLNQVRERYEPTVAVYGANFGSYRNEISSKKLKDCKLDPSVDYYFYTDDRLLEGEGWTMRYPDMLPGDDIMDSNRWTSKATKWLVPNEILKHNIIVWVDSKLFPISYTRREITYLFKNNPDKDLFILKHPYGRVTSFGEMHETVSRGIENSSERVEDFYNILSDFKDPVPLADTCQLVWRNRSETVNLFREVFKTLREFELKRDQCVLNYVISKVNYPVPRICITPDMPITRPVLNGRKRTEELREAEIDVIKEAEIVKEKLF